MQEAQLSVGGLLGSYLATRQEQRRESEKGWPVYAPPLRWVRATGNVAMFRKSRYKPRPGIRMGLNEARLHSVPAILTKWPKCWGYGERPVPDSSRGSEFKMEITTPVPLGWHPAGSLHFRRQTRADSLVCNLWAFGKSTNSILTS